MGNGNLSGQFILKFNDEWSRPLLLSDLVAGASPRPVDAEGLHNDSLRHAVGWPLEFAWKPSRFLLPTMECQPSLDMGMVRMEVIMGMGVAVVVVAVAVKKTTRTRARFTTRWRMFSRLRGICRPSSFGRRFTERSHHDIQRF